MAKKQDTEAVFLAEAQGLFPGLDWRELALKFGRAFVKALLELFKSQTPEGAFAFAAMGQADPKAARSEACRQALAAAEGGDRQACTEALLEALRLCAGP